MPIGVQRQLGDEADEVDDVSNHDATSCRTEGASVERQVDEAAGFIDAVHDVTVDESVTIA